MVLNGPESLPVVSNRVTVVHHEHKWYQVVHIVVHIGSKPPRGLGLVWFSIGMARGFQDQFACSKFCGSRFLSSKQNFWLLQHVETAISPRTAMPISSQMFFPSSCNLPVECTLSTTSRSCSKATWLEWIRVFTLYIHIDR